MRKLTTKLFLCSISILLLSLSSGYSYEFNINKTDFFTVDQACSHTEDGTSKGPFLLLIEQRSVNDLPRADLSSKTIEILKAHLIVILQSEMVVGGKKVQIRSTIYEYEPKPSPIVLTPESFNLLPKSFYPFGMKQVISGSQK